MGFNISPVIDIKVARDLARTNTLKFRIKPDGMTAIEGIIKNKPKYSIDAQYDRVINLDDQFAFLNKVGGIAGVQVGLTNGWTRKIFKGGSYLEISLSARIIRDEINPDVVATTRRLISLANPRTFFTEDETKVKIKDEKKKISEAEKSKQLKELFPQKPQPSESQPKSDSTSSPAVSLPDSSVGEEGKLNEQDTNTLDKFSDFMSSTVKNIASKSPPLCTLSISNYFSMNGFYVKSVSFEFSHEQGYSSSGIGPLYADIDIELTQSEIKKASEITTALTQYSKLVG